MAGDPQEFFLNRILYLMRMVQKLANTRNHFEIAFIDNVLNMDCYNYLPTAEPQRNCQRDEVQTEACKVEDGRSESLNKYDGSNGCLKKSMMFPWLLVCDSDIIQVVMEQKKKNDLGCWLLVCDSDIIQVEAYPRDLLADHQGRCSLWCRRGIAKRESESISGGQVFQGTLAMTCMVDLKGRILFSTEKKRREFEPVAMGKLVFQIRIVTRKRNLSMTDFHTNSKKRNSNMAIHFHNSSMRTSRISQKEISQKEFPKMGKGKKEKKIGSPQCVSVAATNSSTTVSVSINGGRNFRGSGSRLFKEDACVFVRDGIRGFYLFTLHARKTGLEDILIINSLDGIQYDHLHP
ncbi:hypothetical protein U3516DRAFT_767556 [Neocallimastix sp. 'constans']